MSENGEQTFAARIKVTIYRAFDNDKNPYCEIETKNTGTEVHPLIWDTDAKKITEEERNRVRTNKHIELDTLKDEDIVLKKIAQDEGEFEYQHDKIGEKYILAHKKHYGEGIADKNVEDQSKKYTGVFKFEDRKGDKNKPVSVTAEMQEEHVKRIGEDWKVKDVERDSIWYERTETFVNEVWESIENGTAVVDENAETDYVKIIKSYGERVGYVLGKSLENDQNKNVLDELRKIAIKRCKIKYIPILKAENKPWNYGEDSFYGNLGYLVKKDVRTERLLFGFDWVDIPNDTFKLSVEDNVVKVPLKKSNGRAFGMYAKLTYNTAENNKEQYAKMFYKGLYDLIGDIKELDFSETQSFLDDFVKDKDEDSFELIPLYMKIEKYITSKESKYNENYGKYDTIFENSEKESYPDFPTFDLSDEKLEALGIKTISYDKNGGKYSCSYEEAVTTMKGVCRAYAKYMLTKRLYPDAIRMLTPDEEFKKYVNYENDRYFKEIEGLVGEWNEWEDAWYGFNSTYADSEVGMHPNDEFVDYTYVKKDAFKRKSAERETELVDSLVIKIYKDQLDFFLKAEGKLNELRKPIGGSSEYAISYVSCTYKKEMCKPCELCLTLSVNPLKEGASILPLKNDLDALKGKAISLERSVDKKSSTEKQEYNKVADLYVIFDVVADVNVDTSEGSQWSGYILKLYAYSIDKYLTLNMHSKCYTGRKPSYILRDVMKHFGFKQAGSSDTDLPNEQPVSCNWSISNLRFLSSKQYENVTKSYATPETTGDKSNLMYVYNGKKCLYTGTCVREENWYVDKKGDSVKKTSRSETIYSYCKENFEDPETYYLNEDTDGNFIWEKGEIIEKNKEISFDVLNDSRVKEKNRLKTDDGYNITIDVTNIIGSDASINVSLKKGSDGKPVSKTIILERRTTRYNVNIGSKSLDADGSYIYVDDATDEGNVKIFPKLYLDKNGDPTIDGDMCKDNRPEKVEAVNVKFGNITIQKPKLDSATGKVISEEKAKKRGATSFMYNYKTFDAVQSKVRKWDDEDKTAVTDGANIFITSSFSRKDKYIYVPLNEYQIGVANLNVYYEKGSDKTLSVVVDDKASCTKSTAVYREGKYYRLDGTTEKEFTPYLRVTNLILKDGQPIQEYTFARRINDIYRYDEESGVGEYIYTGPLVKTNLDGITKDTDKGTRRLAYSSELKDFSYYKGTTFSTIEPEKPGLTDDIKYDVSSKIFRTKVENLEIADWGNKYYEEGGKCYCKVDKSETTCRIYRKAKDEKYKEIRLVADFSSIKKPEEECYVEGDKYFYKKDDQSQVGTEFVPLILKELELKDTGIDVNETWVYRYDAVNKKHVGLLNSVDKLSKDIDWRKTYYNDGSRNYYKVEGKTPFNDAKDIYRYDFTNKKYVKVETRKEFKSGDNISVADMNAYNNYKETEGGKYYYKVSVEDIVVDSTCLVYRKDGDNYIGPLMNVINPSAISKDDNECKKQYYVLREGNKDTYYYKNDSDYKKSGEKFEPLVLKQFNPVNEERTLQKFYRWYEGKYELLTEVADFVKITDCKTQYYVSGGKYYYKENDQAIDGTKFAPLVLAEFSPWKKKMWDETGKKWLLDKGQTEFYGYNEKVGDYQLLMKDKNGKYKAADGTEFTNPLILQKPVYGYDEIREKIVGPLNMVDKPSDIFNKEEQYYTISQYVYSYVDKDGKERTFDPFVADGKGGYSALTGTVRTIFEGTERYRWNTVDKQFDKIPSDKFYEWGNNEYVESTNGGVKAGVFYGFNENGVLIEQKDGPYVYYSKNAMLAERGGEKNKPLYKRDKETSFEYHKYSAVLNVKDSDVSSTAYLRKKEDKSLVLAECKKENEYRIPYAVQYNESTYDFLLRTSLKYGEFLYYETDKDNKGVLNWGLGVEKYNDFSQDTSKYYFAETDKYTEVAKVHDPTRPCQRYNDWKKDAKELTVDSSDIKDYKGEYVGVIDAIDLYKYGVSEDKEGSGVTGIKISSPTTDFSSVAMNRNCVKNLTLYDSGKCNGVNSSPDEPGAEYTTIYPTQVSIESDMASSFYKKGTVYRNESVYLRGNYTTDARLLIQNDVNRVGTAREFNIVVSETAQDEYIQTFYGINSKDVDDISKSSDGKNIAVDDNGNHYHKKSSSYRDENNNVSGKFRGAFTGPMKNCDPLTSGAPVGWAIISVLFGWPALMWHSNMFGQSTAENMVLRGNKKYLIQSLAKKKKGKTEYDKSNNSLISLGANIVHLKDTGYWKIFINDLLNAKDFMSGLTKKFSADVILKSIQSLEIYRSCQDPWWLHEQSNGVNYSSGSFLTLANLETIREGGLNSEISKIVVSLFKDAKAEGTIKLGSVVSLQQIFNKDENKYLVIGVEGGHAANDRDANAICHQLTLIPIAVKGDGSSAKATVYPCIPKDFPLVRKCNPQPAFVVENTDPSCYNRVRVMYPWQAYFRNLPGVGAYKKVINSGKKDEYKEVTGYKSGIVPYINDFFGEPLDPGMNPDAQEYGYGKYYYPDAATGRNGCSFGNPATRNLAEATPFVRLATAPKASNGRGWNLVPEVGTEVMVDYIGGNIERPFVTGAVYSASCQNDQFSSTNGMTITSASHQIKMTDNFEGSASLFEAMSPMMGNLGVFLNPNIAKMTGDSKAGKIYGFPGVSGCLTIEDGLTYSIECNSTQRTVEIKSNYGSISLGAFTGITLEAPNGDILISGKNVTISAGNNLSLSSGGNIGKSMFLPDKGIKSLLGGNFSNEVANFADNAIAMFAGIVKDVAVTCASKKLNLIDFRLLRCLLEIIFRPIEGTLTIQAGRYLAIGASGQNPMKSLSRPTSGFKNSATALISSLAGKETYNSMDNKDELKTADNVIVSIIRNTTNLFGKATEITNDRFKALVKAIGKYEEAWNNLYVKDGDNVYIKFKDGKEKDLFFVKKDDLGKSLELASAWDFNTTKNQVVFESAEGGKLATLLKGDDFCKKQARIKYNIEECDSKLSLKGCDFYEETNYTQSEKTLHKYTIKSDNIKKCFKSLWEQIHPDSKVARGMAVSMLVVKDGYFLEGKQYVQKGSANIRTVWFSTVIESLVSRLMELRVAYQDMCRKWWMMAKGGDKELTVFDEEGKKKELSIGKGELSDDCILNWGKHSAQTDVGELCEMLGIREGDPNQVVLENMKIGPESNVYKEILKIFFVDPTAENVVATSLYHQALGVNSPTTEDLNSAIEQINGVPDGVKLNIDAYKAQLKGTAKQDFQLAARRLIILKILMLFYQKRYEHSELSSFGSLAADAFGLKNIGKDVEVIKGTHKGFRRSQYDFAPAEAIGLFEEVDKNYTKKENKELSAVEKKIYDQFGQNGTFALDATNYLLFNNGWGGYVKKINDKDPQRQQVASLSILSDTFADKDGNFAGGTLAKITGFNNMKGFCSQFVWGKGQNGGILVQADKDNSKMMTCGDDHFKDIPNEYDMYQIIRIKDLLKGIK